MKITRENYEPYFLDYLEGNLDENLVDDLMEFLQQNPDLKNELEMHESITIPNFTAEYDSKEKLYRHPLDHTPTFENKVVAWMEGDLDENEKREFTAYLEKRPTKKKELKRFEETRLAPDLSVTFAKKEKLYRQPVIRPILFWTMRVAAILLIAIALWNLWPSDTAEIIDQPVVSELQPEKIVPESSALTENFVVDLQDAEKDQTPIKSGDSKPVIQHIVKPSIVESSIVGTENNQRNELSVPDLLPVKIANIEVSSSKPLLAFATQPADYKVEYEYLEQEYLTDKLREKMGLEGFTFAKLMRSGLELASNLTNEKFSYDTNKEGEIVALSLDTHLLGLRIPVGRK
jgi:hypothetical protein